MKKLQDKNKIRVNSIATSYKNDTNYLSSI